MGVGSCLCWGGGRVWDNLRRVTSGVLITINSLRRETGTTVVATELYQNVTLFQKSKSNTYSGFNSHVVGTTK